MLVNIGDKLVTTKRVAGALNEGDVIKVIDVNEDGMISFAFGDDFMHMGIMSSEECERHFELLKEEKKNIPAITSEYVEWMIENSEMTVQTMYDRCTIVTCKLPNGFIIVESSTCVSPENYDEEMGINICLDKIFDKVWELEGYRLQCELFTNENDTENGNVDCYNCYCDECPCATTCDCDPDYCEEDECMYNDVDCDDCDDYDCPYNPNN